MGKRLPPVVFDVLVPTFLAVVGLLELAFTRPQGWAYAAGLQVLAAGILTYRRHRPFLAVVLAMAVLLQTPWVGPQLDSAAAPLLFLSVGCYALARWQQDLRLGVLGISIILAVFWVDYHFVDPRQHGVGDVIFVVTLVLTPFVLGRVVQTIARQAAQLADQQEFVRVRAQREERDRIARDLHDVIAHSVSAMVVQTAVAQELIGTDPERAAAALEEVSATGRRTLAETGRLLHLVRDDEDELGLRPAPGMEGLVDLVDEFRRNGLAVDLSVHGSLSGLPAGVDTSGYRIVQEALTNALKYSADRAVALRVRNEKNGLLIEAENASGGSATSGSGLGLVGMAERVAIFGGELSHRITSEGHFLLVARLPVPVGGA